MSAKPIVIDVTPNTEEWLEARRSGIGASDASACLGLSEWKSIRDVALDKWGEVLPQKETEAQHRGHIMEPAILLAYSNTAEVNVSRSQMLRHKEHDWMIATPDGFVIPFEDTKTLVQVKTANSYYADEWGEDGSSDIPECYEIQVRHEMAVADADSVDIPVVFADTKVFDLLVKMLEAGVSIELVANIIQHDLDYRVYTVKRNMDIEKSLIEAEKEFWFTYVDQKVLPQDVRYSVTKPNTIREATKKEKKLISTAKKNWIAFKRAEKRLEQKQEAIKKAISTDEGIDDMEGNRITWKSTGESVKEVVDWESVAKDLYYKLVDSGCTKEAIEDIAKDHTETVKVEPKRKFSWPWRKWTKEV